MSLENFKKIYYVNTFFNFKSIFKYEKIRFYFLIKILNAFQNYRLFCNYSKYVILTYYGYINVIIRKFILPQI